MITYYNRYNFGDTKVINEIINNITLRKYVFNVDNNTYTIFKNISSFYCKKCDNFSYIDNYCYIHYNKDELNNTIDEYIKKSQLEITNNYKELKSIATKYISLYSPTSHLLGNLYTDYLFKIIKINLFLKHIKLFNKNITYIKNKKIDYRGINTQFDEVIVNKINNYKNNNDDDKKINIYVMILELYRLYNKYISFSNGYIRNINNNKIKYKNIPNNILLYYNIINSNSNIINYIDYIDTEYTIYLSKHLLRIDIYIILNINNEYFEVIIETDESHHYKNKENRLKYDYYKDKYAIKYGCSMIRIHMDNNKITNENINFVLFCINYIIETKKALYYFNDKYINHTNTFDNKTYDEFSDIEDEYDTFVKKNYDDDDNNNNDNNNNDNNDNNNNDNNNNDNNNNDNNNNDNNNNNNDNNNNDENNNNSDDSDDNDNN